MLDAVLAGADSIDRGIPMAKQIAEEMAGRGAWWIPTLKILEFRATLNPDPLAHELAGGIWEKGVKEAFGFALEAGVPIAAGTDFALGPNLLGKELKLMTDFGVTPSDAIVAGTRSAAQCMRMDTLVGTLEAGNEAELLVVDGDPLADVGVLTAVENLSLVMQAGRPCSGAMTRQFPLELASYPRFLL